MSDRAWVRYLVTSRGRQQRRITKLRLPVRLHAERLEERMLMSVNAPDMAAPAITTSYAPSGSNGSLGMAGADWCQSEMDMIRDSGMARTGGRG